MNEDFVCFELAKKLQEKGFVEQCVCYYDMRGEFGYNIEDPILDRMLYSWNKDKIRWNGGNCDAPTISQALRWLREKKGIEVYPNYNRAYKHWTYIARAFDDSCYNSVGGFKSYEQAALAGIEYTLDNLI